MANKSAKKKCRKKIPFDTIEQAREALDNCDLTQLDPPNSIYRCPSCQKFHLTSAIIYKRRKDKGGYHRHDNNRT